MRTWGPGAFDNDDALDLLDTLTELDARPGPGRRRRRGRGDDLARRLARLSYGAWHQGWVDAGTALQGRRTTDQLASVFYRYQHRHDQEVPPEP